MDLSSSAVTKRYLIEPIKLDATIKRSLQPPGPVVPVIECSATLDFVKVFFQQHLSFIAYIISYLVVESPYLFVNFSRSVLDVNPCLELPSSFL